MSPDRTPLFRLYEFMRVMSQQERLELAHWIADEPELLDSWSRRSVKFYAEHFSTVELKGLVPLVLHAVTESLQEVPELNARVEDGELVLLDRYDLGIAVQTEQGLVVPVVHGADKLSLDELDAEVKRLAEAANAAELRPEELRGGTFTVTSAGKAAGLFVTPLINHPEVAILGIHRIEQRPVARDGEVVVRRMGNVSVTFDHRVIDGKRAADFGLAVIGRLQQGA